MGGLNMGNQGRGVNALMGHLEARSWVVNMARSDGDLRCCGRREEGPDMCCPHISDRGSEEAQQRNTQAQKESAFW
jgi:hypothetical protein